MLTQEDDVEIQALAGRGWSVSAIARHTGRDRNYADLRVMPTWLRKPALRAGIGRVRSA
jgi:hypothetical protein